MQEYEIKFRGVIRSRRRRRAVGVKLPEEGGGVGGMECNYHRYFNMTGKDRVRDMAKRSVLETIIVQRKSCQNSS